MKRLRSKKSLLLLILTLGITQLFTSCSNDDDSEIILEEPTIDNVEIGLGNNGMGVIGRDFHFNADILAGDKIEDVRISILQKDGKTYSKDWSFEIMWDQYKGTKNANVHQHFDIPEEAAEGIYDFIIIINDQNGSKLEEKRSISIYSSENVPVNPEVFLFTVMADNRIIYDHANGGFLDPATQMYGDGPGKINKGDNLVPSMTVTGIKDDGKMYVVLINKKHSHRPETIDAIDLSKTVIVDIYEHENIAKTSSFTNYTIRRPSLPKLLIGAESDNALPTANPITGQKIWESGNYYLGMLYHNSTHNISTYKYIELNINYD